MMFPGIAYKHNIVFDQAANTGPVMRAHGPGIDQCRGFFKDRTPQNTPVTNTNIGFGYTHIHYPLYDGVDRCQGRVAEPNQGQAGKTPHLAVGDGDMVGAGERIKADFFFLAEIDDLHDPTVLGGGRLFLRAARRENENVEGRLPVNVPDP